MRTDIQKNDSQVSNRSITIAQECTIYNKHKIEERLERLSEEQGALISLYQRMLENGPERFLIQPKDIPSMVHMYADLPNFKEPLDAVKRQIALCIDSGDPLEIAPMLLLGPPGIGKTYFAQMLASILETEMILISMSSLTAGWLISGTSSQWKGAKPGKVFDALVETIFANPVIIVDEIDKAAMQTQYDPLGALYELLEADTAKKFVDEFAEVEIDASHVIWITTANDISSIPEPIINRMNVHEIQPPDQEQARFIAHNLYTKIRSSHGWGKHFTENPEQDVLDIFSKQTPRDMKSSWMTAFGNAKLAHRDTILVCDLPPSKKKKQSIGF